MARPLHRGSSLGGGGRSPGNILDDAQMKVKPEKEYFDHSQSATDQSYPSVKLIYRILSLEKLPTKNSTSESGFLSDPFIPGTGRSRIKFTLFLLKLSLFVIVALALTVSFSWTLSMTKMSRGQIYQGGYRRLQEQVVLDLKDIGHLSLGSSKLKDLEYCPSENENYVPCFNMSESLEPELSKEEDSDRHCESGSQGSCLVLPPLNYKIPLRWPTGKDVIWLANVKITAQEVLSSGSMTKRMMMLEEEKISFRSESAMFDSIEDYSHQIAGMIGLRNESNFIQAGVRVILDIGCGFGSFGAHLFSSNLLTMCIANYEASGSQVQLTLERGLPAMIASFNSNQLPYPSLSFDMIHCAECRVDWGQRSGLLLVEVDRLLRPGGFFVWTSSVMSAQRSVRNKENQKKWNSVSGFAQNLCWALVSQQDKTAVWKKTSEKKCYHARKPGSPSPPPLCNKGHDFESPYYRPLEPCVAGTQSRRWVPIEKRSKWPSRPTLTSNELKLYGLQAEELAEDSINWSSAVNDYWSLLSPLIFSDHPKRPGDEDPPPPYNMLRNVLDMNARFGGFNAALLEAGKSVWVMNVVPTSAPNHLPLILDRGFLGVLHDWCEAFPTYPRSYDLVHADGLLTLGFGQQSNNKCGMLDLFIEIDRILRPEGWVILRDTIPLIESARDHATRLRWDARVIEIERNSEEKLLVCQKPFTRRLAS